MAHFVNQRGEQWFSCPNGEWMKDMLHGRVEVSAEDMNAPVVNIHPNGTATKDTNPKDAIGGDKLPLHLWPPAATVLGCLGLLDGAGKYGRSNWREMGIKASVYIAALLRHTYKLWEGEDIDPDSGLPHEAHILATVAIMVDAKAAGKFVDDRAYRGRGYMDLVREMTPHVKRLKDLHKGKNPKHWTIQDNPEIPKEKAA